MEKSITLLRSGSLDPFFKQQVHNIVTTYDHLPEGQRDQFPYQKIVSIDTDDGVVSFEIMVRPRTVNQPDPLA